MDRTVRQEGLSTMPAAELRDEAPRATAKKTRAERVAEAQKKILARYADTFRRLAG